MKKKLWLLTLDVRTQELLEPQSSMLYLWEPLALGGWGGLSLTTVLFLGNPGISRWRGIQHQHGFGASMTHGALQLEPSLFQVETLAKPVQHLEVSYLGRKGDRKGPWE